MADPLTPEPLRHRPRLRPLPWWKVTLSAAAVILVGIAVGWWLWFEARDLTGAELGKAHTEAIRTGLTAAAGTGAALALLLAVRRQRATEVALDLQSIDLAQKDAVNLNAWHDAAEKRITELYTKAGDQLGSDKAPVRLAGLHALERLAQGNPDHQQTIVDVICAYLRMPYDPPEPLEDQATAEERHEQQRREQEQQVRLTAQRILAAHLLPERDDEDQPRNTKYWPKIDLNLVGATLIDFDFRGCEIYAGSFQGVKFIGNTVLGWVTFTEDVQFTGATFAEDAVFYRATFFGDAGFSGATFTRDALFYSATFDDYARFSGATFTGAAGFNGATFADAAVFDMATFTEDPVFDEARARTDTDAGRHFPAGWVVRPPVDEADGHLAGAEGTWGYVVKSEKATESGTATPDEAPSE